MVAEIRTGLLNFGHPTFLMERYEKFTTLDWFYACFKLIKKVHKKSSLTWKIRPGLKYLKINIILSYKPISVYNLDEKVLTLFSTICSSIIQIHIRIKKGFISVSFRFFSYRSFEKEFKDQDLWKLVWPETSLTGPKLMITDPDTWLQILGI